jgi:hypothetical protein
MPRVNRRARLVPAPEPALDRDLKKTVIDFYRRLGERVSHAAASVDFVSGRYSPEERKDFVELMESAAEALERFAASIEAVRATGQGGAANA